MLKASSITVAVQILTSVCQQSATRQILKKLSIPARMFMKTFNTSYLARIQSPFDLMKANNLQIQLSRPNISDRVKAKYLLSLDKQQKEPMSIKKTFSRWYINTH
jgi:hypothetical protein